MKKLLHCIVPIRPIGYVLLAYRVLFTIAPFVFFFAMLILVASEENMDLDAMFPLVMFMGAVVSVIFVHLDAVLLRVPGYLAKRVNSRILLRILEAMDLLPLVKNVNAHLTTWVRTAIFSLCFFLLYPFSLACYIYSLPEFLKPRNSALELLAYCVLYALLFQNISWRITAKLFTLRERRAE